MILKVIDAGCGVGKTTAMINYINEDTKNKKFLYITPFLTEVERILTSCKSKNFVEPQELPTKSENIISLIEQQRNIVSTHALFKKLTEKALDLTQFNEYVLIIDETADVIEEIDITKSDLKTIISQYVNIDENNNLFWYATDYEGRFEDYKNIIELGGVKAHRSESGEIISLVWVFPPSIFESFKEVYVLTYMFNGQKAYYEYNNITIQNLYVKDFHLTTEPQVYNYEIQKSLITVIDDEALNAIGNNNGSLSLSWFLRNKDTPLIKKLKNNIYTFFRRKAGKVASDEKLWTTFKDYADDLSGKGYKKSFAPINIRATNDYRKTRAIAYIANKFMKPTLKHFFEVEGIKIEEDTYSLSELIQFVYRSAIRDGKPITVYIPSKRMRELFLKWLTKKDE